MKVKKCIDLGTNKNEGQQVTTVLINGEMVIGFYRINDVTTFLKYINSLKKLYPNNLFFDFFP